MCIQLFSSWMFSKAMTSYASSGAARCSRMRSINVKHTGCLCPARLEPKTHNRRDTGVVFSHLPPCKVPGPPQQGCWKGWWSSSGWVARGDAERFGQRLLSSYLGFEFVSENTVHTLPGLQFGANSETTVDAHLAFACQRFVCRADRVV